MPFTPLHSIQLKNVLRVSPPLERLPVIQEKGVKHVILGAEAKSTCNAILLGKIKENTTGRELINANLWLDTSKPKIILIFGRRGSGKSYDLGILIEGLASKECKIKIGKYNPPIVIFDPLNQFWTLSELPDQEDPEERTQIELLHKWGLDPIDITGAKIYIPRGSQKRHPDSQEFTVDVSEMNVNDWCGFFKVDKYSDPVGQLLSSAYRKVTEEGYRSQGVEVTPKKDYSIEDLYRCIKNDEEINDRERGFARQTCRAILSRLGELLKMPLFQGNGGLNVKSIFAPGKVSVFMLREVDESTRSVIVSLILRNILQSRGKRWENEEIAKKLLVKAKKIKKSKPTEASVIEEKAQELLREAEEKGILPGWVILDEAHTLCPSEGYSAAKEILIEYAKQGRCMGLSLAGATQQPSALSNRLISQRDMIVTHHLGIRSDIDTALSQMNPNFPEAIIHGRETIRSNIPYLVINSLGRGEAIISSDGASRNFIVRMRPRVSAHGGKEPIFV